MSLALIGSSPGFLAIIPPKPEVAWLADSPELFRAGQIHSVALIALVALFVIAWVALSESAPVRAINKPLNDGAPR